jgi:hypothetical protein
MLEILTIDDNVSHGSILNNGTVTFNDFGALGYALG